MVDKELAEIRHGEQAQDERNGEKLFETLTLLQSVKKVLGSRDHEAAPKGREKDI